MRVAAAVIAGAVLLPPAAGQERYELSETDEWRLLEDADASTPEGRLAMARKALAAGDARRAENLATTWIERNPRHPALPEAYLVRGDALLAQGKEYKALFDYEFVAVGYPETEAFVTVIQRELEIGIEYAHGLRRRFLGMRLLNSADVAEELLIRVQERMPGSHLAERAAIELADFYFERREMALAVEMYSIFIENHPDSAEISKARRRLIYAHLATFKGPEFDAAGLREARARLRELQMLEPAAAERIGADALLTRIDESDARKQLLTAQWYLRTGDPIAAELTIRRMIEQYPRTVAATDALRLMDRILPRLPASVLRDAPDYGALQEAMLGAP